MARRRKLNQKQIHQKYVNKYDYTVKQFKAGKISQDQVLPKPSQADNSMKKFLVGEYGEKRGTVGSDNVFMSKSDYKNVNRNVERNQQALQRAYDRIGKQKGYYESGGQEVIRLNERGKYLYGSQDKFDPKLNQFGSQKDLERALDFYQDKSTLNRKRELRDYREQYIETLVDKMSYNNEGDVAEYVQDLIDKIENLTIDEFESWYLTTDEADIGYQYSEADVQQKVEAINSSLMRYE